MARLNVLPPALAATLFLGTPCASAADEPIPYHQEAPPGPALSPDEARARIEVPPGFHVELVANEPDLVNPVAMTIDDAGRIWVVESLEYPRREAGPGRDRVKVFEDADGDGRAERNKVFADGLNIPSGIAVGYGGVWVANAPDLLFFEDTNGDLRADRKTVVVSGFGRYDTHELPNSLTWGPDGWLYGLNGVFNRSRVADKEFTCALWRVHPRSHEFELFSVGTSNPWGLAFDGSGSAFVSACVIDHLWHLVETGSYVRQAGAYPPRRPRLGSIVDHAHYKAAYCGLEFFDSTAYPAEYRGRLYMGNIHASAVNVDELSPSGASYRASAAPDFFVAHDPWCMPVAIKTGPDGCLYILDWYDRYHCYQDAGRDPGGIDRMRGRLYRVRYRDTPRAPRFDLAQESAAELVNRLSDPNVFFRDRAARILGERAEANAARALASLVDDRAAPLASRRAAFSALLSANQLSDDTLRRVCQGDQPALRAWAVRAMGNMRRLPAGTAMLDALLDDTAPEVQLQLAIAATKFRELDRFELLSRLLTNSYDSLVVAITWQALRPLADAAPERMLAWARALPTEKQRHLTTVLREWIADLADAPARHNTLVEILSLADSQTDAAPPAPLTVGAWGVLADRWLAGALSSEATKSLAEHLGSIAAPVQQPPLASDVLAHARLAVALVAHAPGSIDIARTALTSPELSAEARTRIAAALLASGDVSCLSQLAELLADPGQPAELRRGILNELSRTSADEVATVVLAAFSRFGVEDQSAAIELLTERRAWRRALVTAVAAGRVAPALLNPNQVRKLAADQDEPAQVEAVARLWGRVRTERSPGREEMIEEVRELLAQAPGNAPAGATVFRRVCAPCHKLYGEGFEVGPDLTRNGRNSFDQLLSNVFDPSLVIGADYQARQLTTSDGRILSGLLVEDSPERVVLKVQGGKLETVPRDQIDEFVAGAVSMMPEGLEQQLSPQELRDLLAYLALDRPPEQAGAIKLPGAP